MTQKGPKLDHLHWITVRNLEKLRRQHKSQKEYFRDFLILVCVEFYEVFLSISIFTSAGYFARATLSSFKSIPLVEYIRLRISQTSCQFMKIRENSSKNSSNRKKFPLCRAVICSEFDQVSYTKITWSYLYLGYLEPIAE